MKLQSMTAFVMNQKAPALLQEYVAFKKVTAYANLLSQPVNLGMFIPCDEEGSVLVDPELTMRQRNGDIYYTATDEDFDKFQQAEERVLFEGGLEKNRRSMIDFYRTGVTNVFIEGVGGKYVPVDSIKTIEDLITCNLTLTPSAIKQLGL